MRPWVEPLLDALFPPACAACEAHATAPLCALCSSTLLAPPTGSPALFAYGGALQVAINVTKQGGDLARAQALARLLVSASAAMALQVDMVTFVPAPWRRVARRGFDLPAVLAAALAHARGLPSAAPLVVTRTDAPLSAGASREARSALVKGRYRVRQAVAARRMVLVDDVFTTGATMGEATRVLQEAGAVVTPLALAAKA